ncbi:endoplasmic reticulum-Golgi intermediate compartment protein 2 [Tribolium castaneum]|uniref:Endoplasmic reticulum-Golgi intermediate compartment protein 2-like Protein n=1 Tax=Tribolium castaneum TaxID=7070 RepID=D6WF35_TRICA|nr:PREDICTED: endoplasmic reticulum-Golgi intermediate compartment protein 2 [Tribolium castaneum]EEZ99853.1 Endoplasmic reticulum-Golgi intermediate compartment protein 2-like Protein [Tribolium castaneum]|eukprot:XP_966630.3 PREDICTED: endoplasmic reticulum-Golgi intermediate compartment protein 2 [Tribolium castaneum]
MDTEKVTMLRYRGSKLSKIKKIDIFPKIEETFKEKSSVGGTFSVFSFILITWLVFLEINYYLDSKFIFKFSPDTDFDAKLKINVDITVAMPCSNLGADILDSTNQNAYKFGSLDEEDTWFEMAPNQQIHFHNKKQFNSYVREEYHALKDVLWKSRFSTMFRHRPERSTYPNRPHDACRIHGSLILNKVSGNFHITAGKSLNLPRGHIHISAFMSERDYNFSHRIDTFSFGDSSPGIIHPLEGDELITHNGMTLFNYFIEVVPTNVKTFLANVNTYQYSVKELNRPIDHDKGSHGMPGIFFKYDMSALKVTVSQERDHLGMFLARLCSIIGGIFVCSGFVNSFVQFCYNFLMCNWFPNSNEKKELHKNIYKSVPDVVPVNL